MYTLFYRLNEIAVLFFVLTIIFEFEYSSVINNYRYLSIVMCILITIYFVGYHAYIFYDFIPYNKIEIETQEFQYYIIKYGSLLRNIRFQD